MPRPRICRAPELVCPILAQGRRSVSLRFGLGINLGLRPATCRQGLLVSQLIVLVAREWTRVVTASAASLRDAFLDLGRKDGELLEQFPAAAVRTVSGRAAAGLFQKFTYPATFGTFVFKNRHYSS